MRFTCPHCGEPAARPLAPNGVEDTDPDVHAGATWRCSECRKPVVIEPQTPEERRDNFIARVKWLESNTKTEVVELQPLRCKQCGGAVEGDAGLLLVPAAAQADEGDQVVKLKPYLYCECGCKRVLRRIGMTVREMRSGCPCTLTKPCSPSCTCADPYQSGGCQRCASYGSPEQRARTAEWIARLLKSAMDRELKLRATIRNGSDKEAAAAIADMLAPLIVADTHPLEPARLDLLDAIRADPPNYDAIMAAANNYVIAWGEWDYAGRKP